MQLSKRADRAIQKYGLSACVMAFKMNRMGSGASSIALEGPTELKTTRQADAAINAGREIALIGIGVMVRTDHLTTSC